MSRTCQQIMDEESDNIENIYKETLNLMLEGVDKLNVKDNEKAMILLAIIETMKRNAIDSIEKTVKTNMNNGNIPSKKLS